MRDPNGQPVFRCETEDAADMIIMLMRDDDAGQVARGESKPRKPAHGIALPEAAVEKQARLTGLGDKAITLAAAAKGSEAEQPFT